MSMKVLLAQLRTADAMAAQMERNARAGEKAARLGGRMGSGAAFVFHAAVRQHQRDAAHLRAEAARTRASLLVTLFVMGVRLGR